MAKNSGFRDFIFFFQIQKVLKKSLAARIYDDKLHKRKEGIMTIFVCLFTFRRRSSTTTEATIGCGDRATSLEPEPDGRSMCGPWNSNSSL